MNVVWIVYFGFIVYICEGFVVVIQVQFIRVIDGSCKSWECGYFVIGNVEVFLGIIIDIEESGILVCSIQVIFFRDCCIFYVGFCSLVCKDVVLIFEQDVVADIGDVVIQVLIMVIIVGSNIYVKNFYVGFGWFVDIGEVVFWVVIFKQFVRDDEWIEIIGQIKVQIVIQVIVRSDGCDGIVEVIYIQFSFYFGKGEIFIIQVKEVGVIFVGKFVYCFKFVIGKNDFLNMIQYIDIQEIVFIVIQENGVYCEGFVCNVGLFFDFGEGIIVII